MRGLAFSRLLSIVVGIPLVGMALFAGMLTYENWHRYNELTRASSLARLAVEVGRFGGIAMSSEGGATREFVAGTGERPRMETARKFTDQTYAAIKAAAAGNLIRNPKLDQQLKAMDERMALIRSMREKVDAKTDLGPGGSTAVIAPSAMLAIDVVGMSSSIAADPVLGSQIFGLYATMQFTENALVQRGTASRC